MARDLCTYFLISPRRVSVCISDSHLHEKAFVMAASTFGDKLVFEASSLLVELHDGILPTRCQYGTLSSHLQGDKVIEVMQFKKTSSYLYYKGTRWRVNQGDGT